MRPSWAHIAILALILAVAPARAQNVLGIAAVVNDEIISVYDLKSRLSLVLATSRLEDRPEIRERMAQQVLRGMIDDQLKLQEAKKVGIKITERDIERALASIEKQNKMPKGGLKDFLSNIGIDRSVMVEQIEAEIAWAKVVRRQKGAAIKIGEDEIEEVLAEIEANRDKPEHLVSEIVLTFDSKTEANVRTLAQRLIQQLKSGARFEALARNFSQSATAAVGGDLGWLRPGQLSPSLDTALAKLRPGQVSPPVPMIGGYQIFYLRDRRTAATMAQKNITVALRQLFVPIPSNADAAERAGQTKLAGTMAESATSCQEIDRLAKELGAPLSGDLGNVRLSSMPAQLRDVVSELEIGKASAPQPISGGILVLMVCGREGDKAPTADRTSVRRMLTNQRMALAARQYLRDLRRDAFVDIRK
ncbi:MAG: peptidylprolyl isomerase [Rhodospirillales bacterium]|jgi:peptidyl-prolyl cis-trans isomerase SurA|nr:peptidylprolyl isomerase [Rhodospirillales bacterium]